MQCSESAFGLAWVTARATECQVSAGAPECWSTAKAQDASVGESECCGMNGSARPSFGWDNQAQRLEHSSLTIG